MERFSASRYFLWSFVLITCAMLMPSPVFADDDDDDHEDNVVQVAAPTGDASVDVPNIEAALAAASPGAVVQFAPGTYVTGAGARFVSSMPGITLRGAKDGKTTIQGVGEVAFFDDALFTLDGGHQVVRDLTFDGFRTALLLGAPGASEAGYRVRDNRFLQGNFGVVFIGFSDQVTTVENNDFVNLTVGIAVYGKTIHFRRNNISTPDPASTIFGRTVYAVELIPEFFTGINICENNVFEYNRIDGASDGIVVFGNFPDEICRNNVVRGNVFTNLKAFDDFNDGAMVLLAGSDVGSVESNLIEGNTLDGSEGLGILVEAASGNVIVDNEIENLPGEKDTFSVITLNALPGSGIFLSEGTRDNVVEDNEFEDVRNPIVDLGSNTVEDNEIDDDDEDDD